MLLFSMEKIVFVELNKSEYLKFFVSLNAAIKVNPHGCYVSLETPEYWSNTRMFLCQDGVAGFAINNGNIEGVHKNPELAHLIDNKKVMPQIMRTALNEGVEKLDCFGEELTKTYMKFGFLPVAKMKFDINYNPTWPIEKFGEPDVIAMIKAVQDGKELKSIQDVPVDERYNSIIENIKYFDDYKEMLSYRDEMLDKVNQENLSYYETMNLIKKSVKL